MSGIRVIVCGGRAFMDRKLVIDTLDRLHAERKIGFLFHGNAAGADTFANQWALMHNEVHLAPCPAKWSDYGSRAGPIRNKQMLGQGIDLVVAFPGGKGTAHMVNISRKAGVEVMEIPAPTPATQPRPDGQEE
jgi:hypothetical protein